MADPVLSDRPFLDAEPRVSYVVARLERALRYAINERVSEYGLTTLQYTTLSILGRRRGGLSNAQLARRAYMTPQSMSEVIDALERAGLIVRNPPSEPPPCPAGDADAEGPPRTCSVRSGGWQYGGGDDGRTDREGARVAARRAEGVRPLTPRWLPHGLAVEARQAPASTTDDQQPRSTRTSVAPAWSSAASAAARVRPDAFAALLMSRAMAAHAWRT